MKITLDFICFLQSELCDWSFQRLPQPSLRCFANTCILNIVLKSNRSHLDFLHPVGHPRQLSMSLSMFLFSMISNFLKQDQDTLCFCPMISNFLETGSRHSIFSDLNHARRKRWDSGEMFKWLRASDFWKEARLEHWKDFSTLTKLSIPKARFLVAFSSWCKNDCSGSC